MAHGRSTVSVRLGALAGALVLAGLAIDLAGGRWGAYVPSPIPRVYLADLLWAVGCAVGLVAAGRSHRLPTRVVVAAVGCLVFAGARGAAAVLTGGADLILVIRDVLPFGYLALVPFAGLALVNVRLRTFVLLLRGSTMVMLSAFLLGRIPAVGQGFAATLQAMGGEAMWFPGRFDILGLTFGIGVIAWGRFGADARAVRWVQVVLAVAALAAGGREGSQISQVVAVLAIGWAVWRERQAAGRSSVRAQGVVLVGIVVAFTVLPLIATPLLTRPSAAAQAATGPIPATDAYQTPLIPESLGTVRGRLKTYSAVLDATVAGPQVLIGQGVGEADALLRVCGEELVDYLADPTDHKCPVDSGNAPMPVRDPHNWALGMLLYHGLIGIAVLVGALFAYWWRPVGEPVFSLTAVPVALYLVVASAGVLLSSPFGLLPVATFTAFALSRGFSLSPR